MALPKLLLIESSTGVCSVAIAQGNHILAVREEQKPNAHAEKLALFIQEVIEESEIKKSELSAVAVSMGPGSYTGLRIGVSAAKGLCYALDIPLIAVSTLRSLAAAALGKNTIQPHLICPMIDARRMEVYCALYDTELNETLPVQAKILDEQSFTEELAKHAILFVGNGAEKCEALFVDNPNAMFLDNITPSSTYMLDEATTKFENNEFEDVAYFEPFYLKDFITTTPKKKAL